MRTLPARSEPPLVGSPLRTVLFTFLSLLVFGCPLPTNVRYRCETDGTCALQGQVCGPDRFCHPPSDLQDDGGLMLDGGPCVRRDVTAECAAAECGFVNDGCDFVDCARDCPAPQECGIERPNRCAFPRLCTAEGWCWENPLPQGHTLNAGWRADTRHAWFVGEARTILFWDGERSALQHNPAPPITNLFDVQGSSPTEVYAVGSQGVILHFDGTQWEREQTNPISTASFRKVLALGDGGALAGGTGGLLFSRRAQLEPNIRWGPENLGTTDDVRDLFLDRDGRALVLTRRNQLFVRGTQGWEPYLNVGILSESYAAGTLNGELVVAGTGPNGVSVVTLVDAGLEDGGSLWNPIDAGFLIVDLAPGDGGVFLIGQNQYGWLDPDGGVLRGTINGFNQQMTGISHQDHTLLLAGYAGFMATFNLDSTNPMTALTLRSSPFQRSGSNFNAVCGTSPTSFFAVGGNETGGGPRWYERNELANGIEWRMREFSLGGTNAFHGCFAESDRAWFLGDDSKFTLLVSSQPSYNDFTGNFGGVYVSGWGARNVGYYFVRTQSDQLTVSDSGVGNSFEARSVGINNANLRAVWGLSGDAIVTVGQNGNVSRYDGVNWTPSTLGTEDLNSLHGVRLQSGAPRYVASGANGTIATLDELGDVVSNVDPNVQLHEAFVTPTGVGWVGGLAVDGGGLVLRQATPGAPWVEVPLSSPREVNGIFGFTTATGETMWLVGHRGMILRKDP
ncbi:MAG: hypothetical protein JNM17_25460 [Archangium sp.]|nr:hypothetical protein [Archangium sp.]